MQTSLRRSLIQELNQTRVWRQSHLIAPFIFNNPKYSHSQPTTPTMCQLHRCASTTASTTIKQPTSTSTNSGSSSPSATAASSSTPSSSNLSLAAEARWLYRVWLKHAQALPEADRRIEAKQQLAEQFRANLSTTDPTLIRQQLDAAYSKLSFIRMATPKLHHPDIKTIPPFPAAQSLFGLTRPGDREGIQSYVYQSGEIIPGHARSRNESGRTIANNQGITDEQVRRHQALVDRMHFRGPYWEGKPKY